MAKYISPDELATIMKSDKVPMKDFCVVDVRDDDWQGGNIKGSHNSPSHGFLTRLDDLVAQTKDIPMVIFHCTLSQVRGPKAASIYAETRDLLEAEGEDKAHDVRILQGGFQDFQAKYKDDPELVENWKHDVWGELHM
ncbi:Dual specificity phosphatase ibp1 [Sparassis crispa]|uniref:Dual specificity phosphatase ibp1 n=1 Tax=Sparassis crispa TaxID=139825 RepID=A0A401GLM2_9APHY|nr:Dual specificity phosphatase ibp1 [Sparassis crispa]GBE83076.1 Dual specificity phosphatase ibp1 [Sparassis crispa]